MAKFKKVGIVVFAVLMLFGICAMSAGCSDDKKPTEEETTGTFYSLQEAYDKNLLTTEDLKNIAYYNNNEISPAERLDYSIANAIKESAAEYLRNREGNSFPEATADGITIIAFLGSYSDCYVTSITNIYELHPTDVPNVWTELGGVQFNYIGYYTIGVLRIN